MSTDRIALPPPPDRTLPPPGRHAARRRRWKIGLAAVAALLLLGVIFVIGYLPLKKQEQAAAAAAQREANRMTDRSRAAFIKVLQEDVFHRIRERLRLLAQPGGERLGPNLDDACRRARLVERRDEAHRVRIALGRIL